MGAPLAFLFPGQGSQAVGMGKALCDQFAVARRVFADADAALGFSVSRLCFDGPMEDLTLTANTQPALLTASYAMTRVLHEELGVRAAWGAGHSLGEFSALVAAGAVRFVDALHVVRERGQPGALSHAMTIGSGICRTTIKCAAISPRRRSGDGDGARSED